MGVKRADAFDDGDPVNSGFLEDFIQENNEEQIGGRQQIYQAPYAKDGQGKVERPNGQQEYPKKGRQPHQSQQKIKPGEGTDPDVKFGGSYYNDFTVESHDLKMINKSANNGGKSAHISPEFESCSNLEENVKPQHTSTSHNGIPTTKA